MDTNIESPRNNNFIYALGLFCMLSILSSEIENKGEVKLEDVQQTNIVFDYNLPPYYLI